MNSSASQNGQNKMKNSHFITLRCEHVPEVMKISQKGGLLSLKAIGESSNFRILTLLI